MITLICAMGKNREIGEKNKLLWDLPRDMQHFRERTSKKIVVMGRKTFESIGFPLPNRRNIVLTTNTKYSAQGIETFHSIEKILELSNENMDVMVIGGSSIYTLFLPYATHLSLTYVDASFPSADSFFPEFDETLFEKTLENIWKKDSDNIFDMKQVEYTKI